MRWRHGGGGARVTQNASAACRAKKIKMQSYIRLPSAFVADGASPASLCCTQSLTGSPLSLRHGISRLADLHAVVNDSAVGLTPPSPSLGVNARGLPKPRQCSASVSLKKKMRPRYDKTQTRGPGPPFDGIEWKKAKLGNGGGGEGATTTTTNHASSSLADGLTNARNRRFADAPQSQTALSPPPAAAPRGSESLKVLSASPVHVSRCFWKGENAAFGVWEDDSTIKLGWEKFRIFVMEG